MNNDSSCCTCAIDVRFDIHPTPACTTQWSSGTDLLREHNGVIKLNKMQNPLKYKISLHKSSDLPVSGLVSNLMENPSFFMEEVKCRPGQYDEDIPSP